MIPAWITRLGSGRNRPLSRSGRRPRRRIAIIGPDSHAALALGRQLFEVRLGDVHPLQPAGASGLPETLEPAAPAGDAADDAVRTEAVHVSTATRVARNRYWEIAVPRTLQVAAGRSDSWKLAADTMLVAWPWAAPGLPESEAHAAAFRIGAALGQARQQGRLRRVAFVLVGCPEEEQPLEPRQARLEWDRRLELGPGLRSELARARGRCGDPLADPRWRTALEQRLLRDDAFLSLASTTMAALGRPCPVFFACGGSSRFLDALLHWIRRPGPALPARGEKAVRIGVTAAAVACVAALLLAGVVLAPLRRAAPAARVADATLMRAVSDRVAAYDQWLGVRAAFAGTAGRDSLRRARTLLESGDEILTRARELELALAGAEQGSDTTATASRISRGAALRALASRHSALYEAWLARHGGDALVTSVAAPWRSRLTSAWFESALLTLAPRERGFRGYSLTGEPLERSRLELQRLGTEPLSRELAGLDGACDASGFYRCWLAAEKRGDVQLRRADRALPRMIMTERDGGDPMAFARWRQLRVALGRDFGRFVRGPAELRARLARSGDLPTNPPRDMTFVFTAPTVTTPWHVDVRGGRDGLLWATWRSGADPAAGCTLTGHGLRAEATLQIWLNRHSRVHATAGATPGLCVPSDRRALVLGGPEGDIEFSQGFIVHYRIVSGWDLMAAGVPAAEEKK